LCQGDFRWAQQQGWICGAFLFPPFLSEVLWGRQCEIIVFLL
jgi:hypothetical protein